MNTTSSMSSGSIVTVTSTRTYISTPTYRANLTGCLPNGSYDYTVWNDFPHDFSAACAWPAGNNDTAGLQQCCNGSEIITYHNGCGQYCNVGQSYTAALACMDMLKTPNPITVCAGPASGAGFLQPLGHLGGHAGLILVIALVVGLV